MDFSCYIRVYNNLETSLTLINSGHSHGKWATSPPNIIAAKTWISFQLKDKAGFYGAEGYFGYKASFSLIDEVFQTRFGCPFKSDNYVRYSLSNGKICRISYRAKSDDGNWEDNFCPPRDHPLYIEYTIDYKTITTNSSIDSIVASRAKYTIQNSSGIVVDYGQPIWSSSGTYNDGLYSKKPAAFVSGHTDVLTLKLQLDNAMVNVPFSLEGFLNNAKVFKSDTVLGASGLQSVPVSCVFRTDGVRQMYGDVTWRINIETGSNQNIPLTGSTRLELYWLPRQPGKMFTRGVWVTLLRTLYPSITPGAVDSDIDKSMSKYCFKPSNSQYQKLYDSYRGAAHYVQNHNGGFFDIKKYFGGSSDWANCYDQAGVLQTALGAFGSYPTWYFQYPFGFINLTNLLGRGDCNNPFFLYKKSKQIVLIDDPDRTPFFNHAYLITAGDYVLDACQGPYTGKDHIITYLDNSIDTKTTLYSKYSPPFNSPGTANDATGETGVTSVETIPMVMDTSQSSNVRRVRQALGFTTNVTSDTTEPTPAQFFEQSQEDLFAETLSAAGLPVTYSREVLGRDGVFVLKSLGTSGSQVRMRVWLSSCSNADALQRLLEEVASIQLALSPDNIRPVSELGTLAIAIGSGTSYLMWVYHNVFVSLYAFGQRDLLPLAQGINSAIDASLVTEDARNLPMIGDLVVSNEVVQVGDGVEISFPSQSAWIDYDFEGEGRLEIFAIEGGTFRFKATEAGQATVTFLIGNPGSLAVVTRSVTVTINP